MSDLSPDLLSAASLALAALAVLFGLWSPDLKAVSSLPKKGHLADRGPSIRTLQAAQRSKAGPLAVACTLTGAALAPPAARIAARSVEQLKEQGLSAVTNYDATQAMFLVVWVLIMGLAVSTGVTSWQLHRQIKDFESGP